MSIFSVFCLHYFLYIFHLYFPTLHAFGIPDIVEVALIGVPGSTKGRYCDNPQSRYGYRVARRTCIIIKLQISYFDSAGLICWTCQDGYADTTSLDGYGNGNRCKCKPSYKQNLNDCSGVKYLILKL